MVKLMFTMIFIHIFVACVSQKSISENENKILLSAFFNKNSVFMDDSLKITISLKNDSEATIKLYSEGRVVISHYHPTMYITYASDEKMGYILREYTNRNSIIWLKPGEAIQEIFNIKAQEDFFYEGENTVQVYYRNIWDNPFEYKKRKKQKRTEQEPTIMLYSSPIKIIVDKR